MHRIVDNVIRRIITTRLKLILIKIDANERSLLKYFRYIIMNNATLTCLFFFRWLCQETIASNFYDDIFSLLISAF